MIYKLKDCKAKKVNYFNKKDIDKNMKNIRY